MWTRQLSRPVTNIVTHSPRVARSRLVSVSACRTYANANGTKRASERPRQNTGKRESDSTIWLRNTIGLFGTASAAFLIYSYVSKENQVAKPDEAKPHEPSKLAGDFESLYVQKKKNLESPGVYLWGTNYYRVVDPESNESVVKAPRKISYFDGQVLRDLKIDEKSGAGITENGDLVQWGKGFSESSFKPTKTLTGKNLTSLCMSRDRIIALASDGKVYSLPIAKSDQEGGRKAQESSWVPFWSGTSSLSYRILKPALGMTEKVIAVSGGLDHALLLTNSGRVFSVASSMELFPAFGQLGIPGLSWSTRPKGPVDTCHEISKLKGCKITQIAAGDYHSLALSKDGRVYVFGDNSFGQLGIDFKSDEQFVDTPTLLLLDNVYRKSTWVPKVTSIAAGGANSFCTVDAQRILAPGEDPATVRDAGRITADTLACGRGIWGSLGNGKWTHLQDSFAKVKALSGLFEYDERSNTVSPIRLRNISVGTTHASAVMDNKPQKNNSSTSLDKSNDWGYDALWWGGNEHYQLGTGKRSNMPKPTYINTPSDPKQGSQEKARLQIMPRHKGKVDNRTKSMEQKIECGRFVSAIYSAM